MTVPVFVDTNILVYARDAAETAKQPRAMEVLRLLWEAGSGRVSPQILQEYYVTVTRKLRPGLPPADARADVEDLFAWQPAAPTAATFRQAWEIEDRFQLSWWDSLVVASALEAGCGLLLTEDLQHGMIIGNLRVANPFHLDFQMAELHTRIRKNRIMKAR